MSKHLTIPMFPVDPEDSSAGRLDEELENWDPAAELERIAHSVPAQLAGELGVTLHPEDASQWLSADCWTQAQTLLLLLGLDPVRVAGVQTSLRNAHESVKWLNATESISGPVRRKAIRIHVDAKLRAKALEIVTCGEPATRLRLLLDAAEKVGALIFPVKPDQALSWAKEKGVLSAAFPLSTAHVNALASAEKKTQQWLEDQMRGSIGRPRRKQDCWDEARGMFPGLSRKAFDRAWTSAIDKTSATQWSRSGPKSGLKKGAAAAR